MMDVEAACVLLHDAYERAAVEAGWQTQAASRKTWAEVPEANKATMRAAVGELLAAIEAAEAEAAVGDTSQCVICGQAIRRGRAIWYHPIEIQASWPHAHEAVPREREPA